jgi:hypothetical protein
MNVVRQSQIPFGDLTIDFKCTEEEMLDMVAKYTKTIKDWNEPYIDGIFKDVDDMYILTIVYPYTD